MGPDPRIPPLSPEEWSDELRPILEAVPSGIERRLGAANELHESSRISDPTWETLAETYDTHQLMEATMVVGHYHLVAFALNSFGVELDEGLEPLP